MTYIAGRKNTTNRSMEKHWNLWTGHFSSFYSISVFERVGRDACRCQNYTLARQGRAKWGEGRGGGGGGARLGEEIRETENEDW